MRIVIRILSLLIVTATIFSLVVSCGIASDAETSTPDVSSSDSGSVESTPESSTPEASTPEEDLGDSNYSDELLNILPPKMNLGKDMKILSEKLDYKEWLEVDSGDALEKEMYRRIKRVENRLGIELTVEEIGYQGFLQKSYDYADFSNINNKVDLISGRSSNMGNLAYRGYLSNINANSYIDLTYPWWSEQFIDTLSIGEKLFFITGDISPTFTYDTFAVFYNRDLVEKYSLEDPIGLVDSKAWTIDKLIEMTAGVNGDADDTVALTFNAKSHVEAMIFGMGARILRGSGKDVYLVHPIVLPDMYRKMSAWFDGNDGVVVAESASDYGTSFKNGESVFAVGKISYAFDELKDSSVNYSIVPLPMYNTDQDGYLSFFGGTGSFFGVPRNVVLNDPCILLDYLGADGYASITPAIYKALADEQATEEGAAEVLRMMDIIKENTVFDIAKFYGAYLTKIPNIASHIGGDAEWYNNLSTLERMAIQEQCKNLYIKLRNHN